jgi:hypothetical protein
MYGSVRPTSATTQLRNETCWTNFYADVISPFALQQGPESPKLPAAEHGTLFYPAVEMRHKSCAVEPAHTKAWQPRNCLTHLGEVLQAEKRGLACDARELNLIDSACPL